VNGVRGISRGLLQRCLQSLLFALPLCPASAGDVLHAVQAVGSTELTFRDVSGEQVELTVTQSAVGASFIYHDALLWGGDIGRLPKSVVSALQIQRDKHVIYVPLSAYGDLGDVKSVSFASTSRGFRVALHGGNTAASYDATLHFERGVLTRRDVRLRELPDERWEKTMYVLPRSGS
jgi:hypothetical protein